jgi:DNA polymerase-3 subunit alpha
MPGFFTHLHVHTEFSLSDGICRVPELIQSAAKRGMKAIAMTDLGNLYGLIKFYTKATQSGIKPIVGSELQITDDTNAKYNWIFLCQNNEGYKNLTRLISRGYTEGQKEGKPLIHRDWLTTESVNGLLAIALGPTSDIGTALAEQKNEQIEKWAQFWQNLFPNRHYLAIARVGKPNEESFIQLAKQFSAQYQWALVATNAVCFIDQDDFYAHEARVAIHAGYRLDDPKRPQTYTEQQYLRSHDEMTTLFADIPEALENAIQIGYRCNVKLDLGKPCLPRFPIPESYTPESFLAHQAKEGLALRLASMANPQTQIYEERLDIELEVINAMGFSGYFLIVADFIAWAKKNGIPVGPGRGSGAGSLVAYALQITDLDPLPYDLLFERFLNPERVSMPDFDIDFCMERRDEVIDYVARRYGRESVGQIITFGTMAAKAVVRDVARVLGHPYGFSDKIAKLIPFEIGITLEKALEQEELLRQRYEQETEVKELIDLARTLEGVTRNVGKHAGGVVISPSLLTDFAPLYCEEGDADHVVTQFDKDDVETAGLVKFDFLGLRTLTIIDWALKTINQEKRAQNQTEININTIPLDDTRTYVLLKKCDTTAVFQLESRGMKELIKRLQPDCFEDIVALVALFRPGPLQSGMVDDFINRKHGRAKVDYPHPDLEPILKPTYGVILYQEQVMQIAQVLAGYTLGGADLLRRAMGKKKPEEMAKQREIFTTGATARGVEQETAEYIFDLMEKFAGYGFNKSHSAAYALLSYQTAWLKAHYPSEFMAAVLSSDMDNTDKVVGFIEDCKKNKLTILPPCLNHSDSMFTAVDKTTIRYGLSAIKGVGLAALESILASRGSAGTYTSLFDLCRRIDLRKANRRVMEALVRSGALDVFEKERAVLLLSLDKANKLAEQHLTSQLSGQGDLFAQVAEETEEEYINGPALEAQERLQGEKQTLGFYLSGHPFDAYQEELRQFTKPIGSLMAKPKVNQKVAGLIISTRFMKTKTGKKLAIIGLEDTTGRIEATVFAKEADEHRESLIIGNVIVIEGEVNNDDFSGGLRLKARSIKDLSTARSQAVRTVQLILTAQQAESAFLDKIKKLLQTAKVTENGCEVLVNYVGNKGKARLRLGEEWKIHPDQTVLTGLQGLLGERNVVLGY